ncbi:MAG: transaldolase family protein, partial [Planctomycetota bacterium]
FYDTDRDHILDECVRYDQLGPNVIHKVPATAAGIAAMADLLRRGRSVLATEMMSVAQIHAVCRMYQEVLPQAEGKPCLVVTHITGIYDEYLAGHAAEVAPDLAKEDLVEAGFIAARIVRKVLDGYQLPVTLLGGGVRVLRHFTDMVGGNIHVTINPADIEQLVAADQPVVNRFQEPIDQAQRERLEAALPDFRRAIADDGLQPEEFQEFGPVLHFLASFKKGWLAVRRMLEEHQARA